MPFSEWHMPREYLTDMEWLEYIVVPVQPFVVMLLLVGFTFAEIVTFSNISIIGEDNAEAVCPWSRGERTAVFGYRPVKLSSRF